MRIQRTHQQFGGLLFVFFLVLAIGCSSGGMAPTSPEIIDNGLTGASTLEGQVSSEFSWEVFDITFSPGSGGITVEPARTGGMHSEVMSFLLSDEGRPANIGIGNVDASRFRTEGIVSLDVSITHPMNASSMMVFDVMGIVIGNGTNTCASDTEISYAGSHDLQVLNADGYTGWSGIAGEGDAGGDLVLDLTVWDWQTPLTGGNPTVQVGGVVIESPSGMIPGSNRRTIDKHTAPTLLEPLSGSQVGVNGYFDWASVNGANNYVARVTGLLPGVQPYYLPLNSAVSNFTLLQPYYDSVEVGKTYTWALAGTALGPQLSAGDQAMLAGLSYSDSWSFTVK